MILQSKLTNDYPTDDPELYLAGADWKELDPVFAGRLAAFAKDCNINIKLTEGYRTVARQTELYALYKAGKLKSAARPGTSWHEYRLAVDTSTQPIRGMDNVQLAPYGLCKPIFYEGWHIQPIETKGQIDRNKFAPQEVKKVEKKKHWAEKHLDSLAKKGLINSPEIHRATLDEPLTKGQIFALLDRITYK